MINPWPSCPGCGRSVYSVALEWGKRQDLEPLEPARWWAKPCCCPLTAEQHAALSKALRPAWRFDVPEVPPRVTAIRDCDGDVWLRTGDFWCLTSDRPGRPGSDFRDVLPHGPLVECEDPRAAS
jgi:hypothetical protein